MTFFSEVCLALDVAHFGISLWRKELDLPFPVSPPGKSRGGRVPPTPRTLPASQQRWQPSMLRLPPQEGFQNASLQSPLRDPPACHGRLSGHHCSCGLLIQTSVGAGSGCGGLRTKRSG
jgi:hypothetical protein